MHKKQVYATAFISWMVFVTCSSLYSFEGKSLHTLNIPHLDKLIHFTFYFVAGVYGILYLQASASLNTLKMIFKKAVLVLVFFLILFGIIIEVIQEELTQNRSGDFFDALANSVGAISAGIVLYVQFYRKRRLK